MSARILFLLFAAIIVVIATVSGLLPNIVGGLLMGVEVIAIVVLLRIVIKGK